jgi:hypothetical protein
MIFENRSEFFIAGMKAQSGECGGRILLGDNTRAEAVVLRPVIFQCSGLVDLWGFPGI